jgi:hypothetical protein
MSSVDSILCGHRTHSCVLEDRVEAMLLSKEESQASVHRLRAETARTIRERVGAGMLARGRRR